MNNSMNYDRDHYIGGVNKYNTQLNRQLQNKSKETGESVKVKNEVNQTRDRNKQFRARVKRKGRSCAMPDEEGTRVNLDEAEVLIVIMAVVISRY